MNNIFCPFCKNIITLVERCEYFYECKNHHIAVNFVVDKNIIENIILYNSEYRSRVCIDLELNNMNIEIYNKKLTKINVPFDPNLTPENFESKLKTYLIFL
jgi:hypothetical protein